MVKYREILRLVALGVSQESVAFPCGCAQSTVWTSSARHARRAASSRCRRRWTMWRSGPSSTPRRAASPSKSCDRLRECVQGVGAPRHDSLAPLERMLRFRGRAGRGALYALRLLRGVQGLGADPRRPHCSSKKRGIPRRPRTSYR